MVCGKKERRGKGRRDCKKEGGRRKASKWARRKEERKKQREREEGREGRREGDREASAKFRRKSR